MILHTIRESVVPRMVCSDDFGIFRCIYIIFTRYQCRNKCTTERESFLQYLHLRIYEKLREISAHKRCKKMNIKSESITNIYSIVKWLNQIIHFLSYILSLEEISTEEQGPLLTVCWDLFIASVIERHLEEWNRGNLPTAFRRHIASYRVEI